MRRRHHRHRHHRNRHHHHNGIKNKELLLVIVVILIILGFVYALNKGYIPINSSNLKTNSTSSNEVRLDLPDSLAFKCSVRGPELSKSQCKFSCGNRDMDYKRYTCERDKLVCYCKK